MGGLLLRIALMLMLPLPETPLLQGLLQNPSKGPIRGNYKTVGSGCLGPQPASKAPIHLDLLNRGLDYTACTLNFGILGHILGTLEV